ncbi:hypothetical protein RHMOL_Rhmol02G0268900 [Rhododendron molle]|uniref:Uncharacterized protein n=1 Tax=Rhododendron molle TaxID=49168 RepID=A0ACC0PVY4_RHOML|nr:hypothetical protein RHMOL_Rhmol02G0268900 [Rhododendron molle]
MTAAVGEKSSDQLQIWQSCVQPLLIMPWLQSSYACEFLGTKPGTKQKKQQALLGFAFRRILANAQGKSLLLEMQLITNHCNKQSWTK